MILVHKIANVTRKSFYWERISIPFIQKKPVLKSLNMLFDFAADFF